MDHIERETLTAFREHRLSGADVVSVAAHVGSCDACAAANAADSKIALAALVPGTGEEHLTDAELDLLVDGKVDDPSYRTLSRHAASCAMCRAELDDLRSFAAEPRVAIFPKRQTHYRWIAAAAAIVVALTVAFVALRRTPESPAVVSSSTHTTPVPQQQPAPHAVASLVDGSSRIELRDDGTVVGIESALPEDAANARAILSGGSLSIPTFIAAMPGAVRGGTTPDALPIRALEPFRSAVRDTRPRFSWTPVRNARGYRVAVYDADYEEVASSELLTATSWQPSKPLPAGVDLTWHVVADTPQGEISSAGSDRAEAVFRVLAPSDAQEVARGEELYRDSHLLRGLLYSRFGLLHDAERELRQVAADNPNSTVAAKVIASVSRRE